MKYSGRRGAWTELRLRLPEALHVHLVDEAARHGRSLNAEVLELLMAPRRKLYSELSQRAKEMLQDAYGEDWYALTTQGQQAYRDTLAAERTDDQIMAEVDWLPGSQSYNP